MGKKEKLQIQLRQQLDNEKPAVIDSETAQRLRAAMPEVSEKMFRDLLRECRVPLAPEVEGVRQDDFANLERTLVCLSQEYTDGDRLTRDRIRKMVITAKDHAWFAMRSKNSSPEKKAEKEEMRLWMLTWLENPPVFPIWLGLRKSRLTEVQSIPL